MVYLTGTKVTRKYDPDEMLVEVLYRDKKMVT